MSDFNETCTFLTDFGKILKYHISRKSALWDSSCSMQMDGRTDGTKIISTLRNFVNAPKKVLSEPKHHTLKTY